MQPHRPPGCPDSQQTLRLCPSPPLHRGCARCCLGWLWLPPCCLPPTPLTWLSLGARMRARHWTLTPDATDDAGHPWQTACHLRRSHSLTLHSEGARHRAYPHRPQQRPQLLRRRRLAPAALLLQPAAPAGPPGTPSVPAPHTPWRRAPPVAPPQSPTHNSCAHSSAFGVCAQYRQDVQGTHVMQNCTQ